MLEIICLIWLWRVNGKHAIERGQNPKKYRALTLGLWFGLEFTGTFVGAWLMQLLNAGDNAFYGAYVFGIIGAAIGGFTSYWIAKKHRWEITDQKTSQMDGIISQVDGTRIRTAGIISKMDGTRIRTAGIISKMDGIRTAGIINRCLGTATAGTGLPFAPATIHIIEEEGGYTGGQDAFFLKWQTHLSLRPGSEYTFTTYAKKNVLTIGRPTPELSDETTALKFIAGEKGQIEIHACAGRLLPGKFSNYTA